MNAPLALTVNVDAVRLEVVAQAFRDSGITVAVDEALLREIHDAMDAAVQKGEEVAALIRKVAGVEPGPIPTHLITMMLMGTGYHRTGRDTLRKLFVARNAVRRERRKKGVN